MRIELFDHSTLSKSTGIGRYTNELFHHLVNKIDISIKLGIDPPFTHLFSPLHHLPLGIKNHQSPSIVHFTQIMGCSMMLWNPIHPSIATVHDLGVLEMPEEKTMLDPIALQLLRLSFAGLKRMDLIVCVSEFSRQGVIKHLGLSPTQVITVHSGVDHLTFYPIEDSRKYLISKYPNLPNSQIPWLLYVGSELPRKNLAVLLQAIAILKEKYLEVHLVKIGASGGKRFREQTIKMIDSLNLNSSISWIEGISDQELALFYSAADIFVQPSKLEGFGLPVLEAMACGTPVVCSNTGSLPEISGNAAILLDPDDTILWASWLSRVLKDDYLKKRLSRDGLVNANKFNWENTADQMTKVYRMVKT